MRTTVLIALAGFFSSVSLPAQQPTGRPPGSAQHDDQPQTRKAIEESLRQLGSDRFRERVKAERSLRAMGEVALPGLREGAADDSDAEAQWRARRLIRQIESGEPKGLDRRRRGADRDGVPDSEAKAPSDRRFRALPADIQDRFEQLLEDLERDLDSPGARFFHDGADRGPWQQMREMQQRMQERLRQDMPPLVPPPSSLDRSFGQSWQQMREMQQRMQERLRHGKPSIVLPSLPLPEMSIGQSKTIRIDTDGVRVEVVEQDDEGKEHKKVYEAPDLETFQEKYPGVIEQHRVTPPVRIGPKLWQGPGGLGRTPADDRPRGLTDRRSRGDLGQVGGVLPLVPPPPHERLGVIVRSEIPAAVLDYLSIDSGLMVEQVQPDTLASRLDLHVDDIVVRIADRPIGATTDVRAALRAIEPGDEVRVTVLRRGRELVLSAPRQTGEVEVAEPAEQRQGGQIR